MNQPALPQKIPLKFPITAFLVVGGLGLLTGNAIFASVSAMIAGALVFLGVRRRTMPPLVATDETLGDPIRARLKTERHAIAQTKYLTHVADLGDQAFAQIKMLSERFELVMKALQQKFSPTEITYSRYETATQSAVMLVLDHLNMIEAKLRQLDSTAAMPSAKETFETQKQAAIEMLKFNDTLLAQLDGLLTSLQQTTQAALVANLDDALDRLKTLAEQAKKYS